VHGTDDGTAHRGREPLDRVHDPDLTGAMRLNVINT
jgi:hypothetical protein